MSALHDAVRDVIAELDCDGGGFQTAEAANLLLHNVISAGVVDEVGNISAMAKQLMRWGASQAIGQYKPEQLVVAAMASPQGDFVDVSDDYHHWLQDWSALDESHTATRKKLVRMNLDEVRKVIALKRKKAAEATEVASRLQRVIDLYPIWSRNPSMTLGDVLGVDAQGAD